MASSTMVQMVAPQTPSLEPSTVHTNNGIHEIDKGPVPLSFQTRDSRSDSVTSDNAYLGRFTRLVDEFALSWLWLYFHILGIS